MDSENGSKSIIFDFLFPDFSMNSVNSRTISSIDDVAIFSDDKHCMGTAIILILNIDDLNNIYFIFFLFSND